MSKNNYKSFNYIKFMINRKNELDYLKNGGAYMANNNNLKIEKEKVQIKNQQNTNTLPSDLKDKFSGIDKKYDAELSTWRKKQQEFTLDSQEAQNLADEKLSEYRSTELGKIENKYLQKEEKIDSYKISATQNYYKNLQKVGENHEEDKKDLRFGSVKKGWRVSSIYDNETQQIEDEYQRELLALKDETSRKLASLNFKQNLLEQEKEDALEKFDISYAQKLSDKIEQIQKEFEKENASQKKNADEKVKDLLLNVGREKTAEVLAYLQGKSKDEALQFVKDNPSLKDELGVSWHNALVAWINKR